MKPTPNAFLSALHEFGKAAPRRPPGDGWFTIVEYAAMGKTTVPAIKYGMQKAEQRGVTFESAYGTMPNKQGIARKAVFFRLSKNGKH